MAWWVYKCNSTNADHQVAWGDWSEFFEKGRVDSWGSTELIPQLSRLGKGHQIIAYQSNTNELVGLAEVVRLRNRDTFLDVYLKPVERIGVKVRPLKKRDPCIRMIPALQPGPIRTLYEISPEDARALLRSAGLRARMNETPSDEDRGDLSLEERFIEGERRAQTTATRNPRLRLAAKRRWGLRCYCCGFAFGDFYGSLAAGTAVVHHLDLFDKGRQRDATVDDVRVVCANCHHVLHLRKPPLGVDELRKHVRRSWGAWNLHGIQRKSR